MRSTVPWSQVPRQRNRMPMRVCEVTRITSRSPCAVRPTNGP